MEKTPISIFSEALCDTTVNFATVQGVAIWIHDDLTERSFMQTSRLYIL